MSVRGRTIPTPLPIPESKNGKKTIEKINDYTTLVNSNNKNEIDYIKNCIPNYCQMEKIDETIVITGLNCYEPVDKCNTEYTLIILGIAIGSAILIVILLYIIIKCIFKYCCKNRITPTT
jgi:hypothetical protein